MVDKNNKQITWLEFRSIQTGKSIDELKAEMSEIGKLGGQARKGKHLSQEHRLKIAEGRKNAKKETKEEVGQPTEEGS